MISAYKIKLWYQISISQKKKKAEWLHAISLYIL